MPTRDEASALLCFVQVNDLHVQSPENHSRCYRGVNERARWFFDAVREQRLPANPDFVLALGDLVQGPALESLAPDYAHFAELARDLPCPLVATPGNHDVGSREGDPQWEAAYRQALDPPAMNYTFVRDGLRFVMLDNAGAGKVDAAAESRRREWLEQTLADAQEPVLLCCHVPLFSVREWDVLAASCGFPTWIELDRQLSEVVERHAQQVVAVLSAHQHLTGVAVHNDVRQIVVGGLASLPSDYGLYRVYADRIEVEIIPVPRDLVDPDSDIHGRPRHDREFTDAAHPTHATYIGGNPDERRFVLPLRRN